MIYRFLIFGGDGYYPTGGWQDFLGAHWSKEAAIGMAKANLKKPGACDWTHVIDLKVQNIIWSSENK